MNKCMGIFGAIFGHKFSGRYNEKAEFQKSNLRPEQEYNILLVNERINVPILKRESTYVCSICQRCGTVIKKEIES